MDISLRLDTLGVVELRYLRGRERYRDWPQFQLLAASRQARVFAYMSREAAEQLHQQILVVEEAIGLDAEQEEEGGEPKTRILSHEDEEHEDGGKTADRESSSFSPSFAQALRQLNELARQRLGDSTSTSSQANTEGSGLTAEVEDDEEDALEQLQDAFTQMMEVVRELAEEMATDALKITGRFKCARTNIEFIPRATDVAEDEDDDDEEEEHTLEIPTEGGLIDLEVELVMLLQLFEEGHSKVDDLPAVELQLDVDDFERLHETLDYALERERRSRRRR